MQDLFDTDQSFEDLGLSKPLLKAVERLGYEHPTRVQSALIPLAMARRDVLAQSATGSGKTAAFGLPLLDLIDRDERFSAFILAPTRELAMQVSEELRELSEFSPIRVAAVYGGQRIKIQAEKLKRQPHIVVGTPGRVMDMHRRGLLPYENTRFVVLDEVDRMLDIGFREDIRLILGGMRKKEHTIFVSATISSEIEKLARLYMKDPEKIVLTTSSKLTVSQVKQRHFAVQRWDKNRMLVHLLKHEEPALTLVFCRTKSTVDGLTSYLNRKGVEAHSIHGDMYQSKRNQVMMKLRNGELSVLVASDLAARGLDVDDITHVINYDLPEDPEVYVHRVGRTARAGRDGVAWSFLTPDQGDLLTAIEMLTNVEIPLQGYDDFEPSPPPADVRAQLDRARERQDTARTDQSRTTIKPPAPAAAADPNKFPGGVVPTALPGKRMGGRLKSRRR